MVIYSQSSKPLLRRPLEPNQYVSIRYTERLAEAGIESSVGSVGDSYGSVDWHNRMRVLCLGVGAGMDELPIAG